MLWSMLTIIRFIVIIYYHLQKHDLAAAIGGIVSLYVGVSFCTMLEFLEFLFDVVLITIKRPLGCSITPPDEKF